MLKTRRAAHAAMAGMAGDVVERDAEVHADASPRMSFDRLAPHYRWIEWLFAGEKLQRCRTACLHLVVPAPRRVLLMGEGNGRSLVAMLRAFPEARFTCVDASARMLECARARLHAHGLRDHAVEFIHADIHEWPVPAQQFDLLVTHFFLDCFRADQLPEVVRTLTAAATPDARWPLADFRVPAAGFAKWRAQAILWSLYLFFRQTTRLPASRLTPPDPFLRQCGFALRERRLFEWGLLHSDLWELGES